MRNRRFVSFAFFANRIGAPYGECDSRMNPWSNNSVKCSFNSSISCGDNRWWFRNGGCGPLPVWFYVRWIVWAVDPWADQPETHRRIGEPGQRWCVPPHYSSLHYSHKQHKQLLVLTLHQPFYVSEQFIAHNSIGAGDLSASAPISAAAATDDWGDRWCTDDESPPSWLWTMSWDNECGEIGPWRMALRHHYGPWHFFDFPFCSYSVCCCCTCCLLLIL